MADQAQADDELGFDQDDAGRCVGFAAAAPGWWAVYHDEAGDFRCPVAAWVLREYTARAATTRRLFRHASVQALDPTGDDWMGSLIEHDNVEYVYDPRPETLEAYLAEVDSRQGPSEG